jgi:hypothetical protein
MNKISTIKNEATVCVNRSCVTVQGDAARVINTIAIGVAIISAIAVISKLLK